MAKLTHAVKLTHTAKLRCLAAATLLLLDTAAAQSEDPSPARYLGQMPPGPTPQVFAPGLVSTDAVELNSVFSPDGREFFFTRLIEGPDEQAGYPGKNRLILFHSAFDGTAWSAPRPLRLFPGAPHAWAADMSLSPDGQRLYFMGPHPTTDDSTRRDLNIWVSHRDDGNWSVAEPLAAPVNSPSQEVYSSVVRDGSLYFTSYPTDSGEGRSGLYRAQAKPGGGFAEPQKVTIPRAGRMGDTFVAPDESYLIFSAGLPDSIGASDLYLSFKAGDGGWDAPIHLRQEINSALHDYCPVVSPDGKYLFFSRRRSDPATGGWPDVVAGDVYWVSTEVIDRLRPK